MKKSFKIIISIATYIFCVVTFTLMLSSILDYTTFDRKVAFLQFKQRYVSNPIWLTAFYIHVFSAFVALFCFFTQFSKTILKFYPKVHRVVGKIYVWDILIINFPTAMIIAQTPVGGISSRIAFIMLDCLWFYFTYKGIVLIKKGHIREHKYFMMRSYALTFSAITLRLGNMTFTRLGYDPLTIYMIFSWMGWVPNLIFAEYLILKDKRGKGSKSFSKVITNTKQESAHLS